jgi:quinoprotein glucose dehydrogenase
MPDEHASPTQPYPVRPPPLSAQKFDEEDATNISPGQHDYVVGELKKYRHGNTATPPSTQGTISIPGQLGGANWSGASFDPTSGFLYINTNNLPYLIQMRKTPEGYDSTGYVHFRDQQNYPAIKPPWGLLTAIDLNKGEFAWQVPLGEYPELTKRGVPKTGTENLGGTIVTAGGLVFIGATKDEQFHAFDKRTGELLWQANLPAGGYATPCTYMIGGKQYVVIAAGGGGKFGTKSGDQFVAFALP